jgi:hypothetical protein
LETFNGDPPNVTVWEKVRCTYVYGSSWYFMFNSTWECNPLVLREAIGYGKSIIARISLNTKHVYFVYRRFIWCTFKKQVNEIFN